MFTTPSKDKDHSSNTYIQPQLEVGSPDDEYEKEANDVADKVMRMPESDQMPKMSAGNESVQMMRMDEDSVKMTNSDEGKIQMMMDYPVKIQKMSDGNKGAMAAPQKVEQGINSSKGSGQPLPSNTQADLGTKMNADLSNVKVHTDSNSVQMNKEIGAKAFTHGNDIYFNQGQYNPQSSQGKHLLAHELTHTVQQSKLVQPKIQRQNDPPEVKGTEKQGDVSGSFVFIKGGDANQREGLYGKWVKKPSQGEVDEAYLKIQDMISQAREAGGTQAAANLQYWLDGKGGRFDPSFKWLFSVPAVMAAQDTNIGRFFDVVNSKGQSLEIVANEMKKGETRTFKDYWDSPIHVSAITHFLSTTITSDLDFAYAYGGATLVSTGEFIL